MKNLRIILTLGQLAHNSTIISLNKNLSEYKFKHLKKHKINEESRNSWIASLITLGEGWHNNHHANSKDWNNQENWWEFDPPAWIIRLIKN